MPFIPRTKEQIRDSLLANLQSRYQALTGLNVDIREGSHMWMRADAIALELAGIEAAYELETKQILPDQADTDFLDRHGIVEGLPRELPTAASHTISILGTPGATIAFGSATLVATTGLTYVPTTSGVTLDAITGLATITVVCQTAGTTGTLAVGTLLQWSAAPTGLTPTATVTAVTAAGTDTEKDPPYAARILARRQERPASFNRADVVAICQAFHSVTTAYVYPLLQPDTDLTGIPGTLTVVVLGPIPADANGVLNGDNPTNTRFIGSPGSQQTDVEAYIEGTVDTQGVTVPLNSQVQLRPLSLPSGNYRIRTPDRTPQSLTLDVVVTAANQKQWGGTLTVDAGGTNDATHVTVAGNHTDLNGLRMLVLMNPVTSLRGYYRMVTPTAASFNAGPVTTTFTVPSMPGSPFIGTLVYPAPANYPLIRLAIFQLYDRLTPGDAASPSNRWPADDVAGPSTLYIGEIIAAVCAVPGVINCTVSLPVANVTATLRHLIDLANLTLTSN